MGSMGIMGSCAFSQKKPHPIKPISPINPINPISNTL